MDTPFNHATRTANLDRMAAESFDLLVIGAGITGAGIARDAAMRGLSTAIVDKGDFAAGTSSNSSRLIHGGLRYLEHRHWKLVFEASRERRVLLRIAPHLVWPRSFIFPIHKGCRVRLWELIAGLWLYDLLAVFRNVRRHQMLGKKGLLRAEPGLKERGLKGGARYFDAQCDDARLTLANIRDAHHKGASVANYTRVDRLMIADGRVRGAHVTDLVTGIEHVVRARIVVNATGPWTDDVARPAASTLHPTAGAHVLVPAQRIGNREAVTMISPIDGRVLFAVPWGAFTYIGTTESENPAGPDAVRTTADEVVYLLRTANAFFPEARLTPADVVSTWAGLRPLIRITDDEDANAASREHQIIEAEDGLMSIVGGKLTTYRKMAAELVDVVARRLHEHDGRATPPAAPTDREPLPGGETRDLDILVRAAENDGFPREHGERLVRAYGSESSAIIRLTQHEPNLGKPVTPHHPTLWGELVFAMRREMAITLTDLLVRRTHVFYETADHGMSAIEQVADVAAAEMQWDDDRRRAEIAAYGDAVNRIEAFRAALAAPAS